MSILYLEKRRTMAKVKKCKKSGTSSKVKDTPDNDVTKQNITTKTINKRKRGLCAKNKKRIARNIKNEQASKSPAIKRACFSRQVKLALSNHSKEGSLPYRITPKAISALHEASERFIVERLSDACAISSIHGKQTPSDVHLRLVSSLKPIA